MEVWNESTWSGVRRPVVGRMSGSWPLTGVEDGCGVQEGQMKTAEMGSSCPRWEGRSCRSRSQLNTSPVLLPGPHVCMCQCALTPQGSRINAHLSTKCFLKASFNYNFWTYPPDFSSGDLSLSERTHHSVTVIYPVFARVHVWYIWFMLWELLLPNQEKINILQSRA